MTNVVFHQGENRTIKFSEVQVEIGGPNVNKYFTAVNWECEWLGRRFTVCELFNKPLKWCRMFYVSKC